MERIGGRGGKLFQYSFMSEIYRLLGTEKYKRREGLNDKMTTKVTVA